MSPERDELTELELYIRKSLPLNRDAEAITHHVAKQLHKAGYRKPRLLTTVEELTGLPNSAVIRDRARDVAEKRGGLWCSYETSDMTDRQMAKFLPVTVLDEGQE